MSYAFTQDVPINAEFYRRITDRVGTAVPPGMLLHLAIALPQGGLRYIDVWESEQDWQRFVDERLHPVVHGLLGEIFGDNLPPEPAMTPLDIVHVWQAGAS